MLFPTKALEKGTHDAHYAWNKHIATSVGSALLHSRKKVRGPRSGGDLKAQASSKSQTYKHYDLKKKVTS